MKEKIKAVIYARYSSDNQRQESIDAQVRACQDYAESKDYNIVHKYTDEAKSATSDQRPAFQSMIADADNKKFDVILVHKLDRFARDKYDSVFYKRKIRSLGIKIESVTERIDGSPESLILESMLEGMAEYYSRNLSREVMKGRYENALHCKHTSGPVLYGYSTDADNNYVINQKEAAAVRGIFKLYLDGYSRIDILMWLNAHGHKSRRGKPFSLNTIQSMLRNEKYMGVFAYTPGRGSKFSDVKEKETIRIENGMPAIVSKQEFLKVQEKIKYLRRSPQVRKAIVPYLLTGKAFCGKCGGRLQGNSRKSKRGDRWSGYQCANRREYKTCDFKEMKKELIEKLVLDHLENVVFSDKHIEKIANVILDAYRSSVGESVNDVSVLKDELLKTNEKIENIVSAIENGMYHPSMKKKLDELELHKNDIANMIAEETKKTDYNFTKDEVIEYLSLGKGISNKPIKEQQAIINTYVQRVDVFEDHVDIILYLGDNEERGQKRNSLKFRTYPRLVTRFYFSIDRKNTKLVYQELESFESDEDYLTILS